MPKTAKVLAALLTLAAMVLYLATGENSVISPRADAATAIELFEFEIAAIEDLRRASKKDSMYGFLLDVNADGQPELSRTWLVTGQAPAYRPLRDIGRTYNWEIHDVDGQTLASGRHFDRLFNYTSTEEGACEKGILGAHSMMIRTPAPLGAAKFVLSIESTRSDRED